MKTNRILTYSFVSLICLEVFVIILSWMISTLRPDLSVNSLMGSDGVRWLFATSVSNVISEPLAWLLLLSVGLGLLVKSGLLSFGKNRDDVRKPFLFQHKLALRIVFGEMVIVMVMMFLLTCLPHAVLANVNGDLFPGPFSKSIVSTLTATVSVCSISYGVICGTFGNITSIFNAIVWGIRCVAPLIPVLMMFLEVYETVKYAFNL